MDERLIVALDVPSVDAAKDVVSQCGEEVGFYKIGYQLFYAEGGAAFVTELKKQQYKIFLDLKLLDIDNTIKKGIKNIKRLGVDMLTVHAYPKTMKAAVSAIGEAEVCLLGVTALTSMDDEDMKEAGYAVGTKEVVRIRAEQAKQTGMGGVVASAQEAEMVREIVGPEMAVVTPGIRFEQTEVGDQKRVMSPKEAIKAGASHLVVGRPIVEADNPNDAARRVIEEINKA